jgi:hypothetical protein
MVADWFSKTILTPILSPSLGDFSEKEILYFPIFASFPLELTKQYDFLLLYAA